jgi:copper chaperone CopZ
VKGVKSIKVDFKNKQSTIEFDESVISSQEVAEALSGTPHMMGKDMQYGGILVLSVPGLKDEASGKKAEAALKKVEGVAKVILYPQQQAVGIVFADRGKTTSKQLIEALDAAGLKGTQYGASLPQNGPGGQAMNGMPNHAGMAMGNGGTGAPGAMGGAMGCPCMPGMEMMPGMIHGASARGGCCCR